MHLDIINIMLLISDTISLIEYALQYTINENYMLQNSFYYLPYNSVLNIVLYLFSVHFFLQWEKNHH